jgi:hypothetical protein
VIIAWAEGKDVQVRDEGTNRWYDVEGKFPIFNEDREHRIKPPPPKYRVALFEDTISGSIYTSTADKPEDAEFCEKNQGFVRWLTDWVDYEE